MENFLNLRPDCQKESRQSMKLTRDVFDATGSEKFKAPSFLAHPAGTLKHKVTRSLMTVKCQGFIFLVKYEMQSSI